MTSKAQRKRSEAALAAFHTHYASDKNWGLERWTTSLYPALCKPKVYAVLNNRFLSPSSITVEDTPSNQAWSSLPFTITPNPPAATNIASLSDPNASLLSHYVLDPASLIPVALLCPIRGESILDLCAAPGGKAFAIAQLLLASSSSGTLHVNEIDPARNKRLGQVLASYIPRALLTRHVTLLRHDGTQPGLARLLVLPRRTVTQPEGTTLEHVGYDKVLLDAPCSSERHVVAEHVRAVSAGQAGGKDMSSFRPGMKPIVKTQAALLMNALRLVRVGGRVVYSTCSVDRAENEGVVGSVVEKIGKGKEGFGVRVLDAFEILPQLERVAERARGGLGGICLPDSCGGRGWGPIYFCVLEKIAD